MQTLQRHHLTFVRCAAGVFVNDGLLYANQSFRFVRNQMLVGAALVFATCASRWSAGRSGSLRCVACQGASERMEARIRHVADTIGLVTIVTWRRFGAHSSRSPVWVYVKRTLHEFYMHSACVRSRLAAQCLALAMLQSSRRRPQLSIPTTLLAFCRHTKHLGAKRCECWSLELQATPLICMPPVLEENLLVLSYC